MTNPPPSTPSLRPTTAFRAITELPPLPPDASPPPPAARLDSIDILRGLVMVVMLLDHTRDYTHASGFSYDPTDMAQTTPAVFLTRWVTHFCAPIFVFLAGTSIYLQLARGKSVDEMSRFLVRRGFWLIALEFTVIKATMWFNVIPTYLATLQVIWVLGVCMIVMAALIRLPDRVVLALSLGMIALHNLFDDMRVAAWTRPGDPVPSAGDKLWMLLHQGGQFPVAGWPSPVVFAIYPLIPWFGVMGAGYAFGELYSLDGDRRRATFRKLGLACLVGFAALRVSNLYGDAHYWSVQPRGVVMSIASFVNVTKYPPSLLFLLMTLGTAFLLLPLFEGWNVGSRLREILVTFGRVPLFYYLLQWPTAHLIAVLAYLVARKPVAFLFMNPQDLYANVPPGTGFPIVVVWGLWLLGVALLYPVCRWYSGFKARGGRWWLKYL